MAKGFDKPSSSRRGGGGGTGDMGMPVSSRSVSAHKLGEIVSDLYLCTDERDIKRMWTSAHRLMQKLNVDPERVEKIMTQKRIGALSTLATEVAGGGGGEPMKPLAPVTRLSHDGKAKPDSMTGATDGSQGDAPSPAASVQEARSFSHEMLKSAIKAFKKRLKLTKLDQESKVGHGPMSGGKQSAVVAIIPPREYPKDVWDELVRQGKLRDTGRGFYELIGSAD